MWLLTSWPLCEGSEGTLHRTESKPCLNDLAGIARSSELIAHSGSKAAPWWVWSLDKEEAFGQKCVLSLLRRLLEYLFS